MGLPCKKMNQGIFLLKQLKQMVGFEPLKPVYYAVIYYHLMINAWGCTSKKQMNRVFVAQKRAIWVMTGLSSRDTCKTKFKELKLLTVPALYIYMTVIQPQKTYNRKNSDIHNYETRNKDNIYIDYYTGSFSKKNPKIVAKIFF